MVIDARDSRFRDREGSENEVEEGVGVGRRDIVCGEGEGLGAEGRRTREGDSYERSGVVSKGAGYFRQAEGIEHVNGRRVGSEVAAEELKHSESI